MDTKMRVAMVCGIHPNMPGDDTGLYKNVIDQMKGLQQELDFEFRFLAEPIRTEEDAAKGARFVDDEKADLALIFNASLPYGRIILPFGQVKAALGLWSVPEPTGNGVLQLNSFCGLNMLGSILKNYFPEEDIKYKWFYGMPDSQMFLERFTLTLRALRALKALKTARIGQVGDLADGFENLYVDERELNKKFGTYIQTRHTVEEMVRRAESLEPEIVEKRIKLVLGEGTWNKKSVDQRDFEKFARLSIAFEDFAGEHKYDALAISCWSRFQEVYDVAVCGAMSRLNENGIVAPCEADITSAVSMLLLNALNGGKASLNDMVSLDENDNSLNLWHCGVAPACWADKRGVSWDAHFNIGHYDGKEWIGRGVVADMNFKAGPVTVFAMQNNFNGLFILTGDIMGDKPGFSGSGGWMNNLKLNDNSISVKELINTITVTRVNHHYPTARGNLVNELNELAFWKDLNVINTVPYKPYMQKFSDWN